jgi:hypothetical protein
VPVDVEGENEVYTAEIPDGRVSSQHSKEAR